MHTPDSRQAGYRQYIDDNRISALQWTIFALCFAIMFIDGLDTILIGFIAPYIGAQWQLDKAAMTPVFSAGLIGLMVAGCGAGILADRIGRRPLLLLAAAIFALANLATVFVNTLDMLIVLRLITGLGLGAAMPCAVTLVAEYAPARRRSLIITSMYCGYTLGGAVAGWLTQLVAPQFGWHAMFVVGAALPLVLLPLLWRLMPESIAFLAERQRNLVRVNALLSRITGQVVNAQLPEKMDVVADSDRPFRRIISSEYRLRTIVLWTANGCGLMVMFTLINWLPSFLVFKQFPGQVASHTASLFQIGGVFGALLMGLLMDLFGGRRMVVATYLVVAALSMLWGVALDAGAAVLIALAALAGAAVMGGQTGFQVLAASTYPVSCRATGLAWMQSIGRFGGILGIQLAGWGIARHADPATILSALAVPALVAGLCAFVLGIRPRTMHGKAMSSTTPG